jgi:hypothetical protein
MIAAMGATNVFVPLTHADVQAAVRDAEAARQVADLLTHVPTALPDSTLYATLQTASLIAYVTRVATLSAAAIAAPDTSLAATLQETPPLPWLARVLAGPRALGRLAVAVPCDAPTLWPVPVSTDVASVDDDARFLEAPSPFRNIVPCWRRVPIAHRLAAHEEAPVVPNPASNFPSITDPSVFAGLMDNDRNRHWELADPAVGARLRAAGCALLTEGHPFLRRPVAAAWAWLLTVSPTPDVARAMLTVVVTTAPHLEHLFLWRLWMDLLPPNSAAADRAAADDAAAVRTLVQSTLVHVPDEVERLVIAHKLSLLERLNTLAVSAPGTTVPVTTV